MKQLIILLLLTTVHLQAQEAIPQNNFDINPEFGGNSSLGFTILGDGLSFLYRKQLKNYNQIESSIGGSVLVLTKDNDIDEIDEVSNLGLLRLGAGYNVFFGEKERIKKEDHKIRRNYLSIKGGAGISKLSYGRVGITWHREWFRKEKKYQPRHSTGFDLGYMYHFALNDWDRELDNLGYDDANYLPFAHGIYFRLEWNFFTRRR